MLDKPEIVQTAARPAAVIRFTIPREEIQNVMGPGIGELMATIGAQGIAPAGPIYSHHFKMDPRTFDFELGIVVARPITAAGRVIAPPIVKGHNAAVAARTPNRPLQRPGFAGG